MHRLTLLLAIATLSGCWLTPSQPVVVSMPPDQNVSVPIIPSTTPGISGAVKPWIRNPIALERPIEPKNNLLANPLQVELVAGGTYGAKDGTRADAALAGPISLIPDEKGNLLVVENGSSVLRKVTPDGVVSTVSGPDGKPLEFKDPKAVAADKQGNLYVAEGRSNRILKVAPGGTSQSLAGDGTRGFKNGRGKEARFSQLESICVAADGTVFVGERGGLIRRIAPDGDTTTYAGGGGATPTLGKSIEATSAKFFYPAGLAFDSRGRLIVADNWQEAIRAIDRDGKFVTTIAGNGLGFVDGANPHNKFSKPSQLAIDAQDNIYVADSWNNCVRKVSRDGVVTTLVGDGFDGKVLGLNDRARLYQPQGVALTPDGTLFIADSGNNRIVKVQLPKP